MTGFLGWQAIKYWLLDHQKHGMLGATKNKAIFVDDNSDNATNENTNKPQLIH